MNFEPKKLFVSAPSHFCKSSNMDMIQLFYGAKEEAEKEEARRTFQGLKIMENPQASMHFCAHPVLFVDFKITKIGSYNAAVSHFFQQIREAYVQHRHFLQQNLPDGGDKVICQRWWDAGHWSDLSPAFKLLGDMEEAEGAIKSGLVTLCKCLFEAHGNKRVLLLVDEADAVINAALSCNLSASESDNEVEKVANLMQDIFGLTSKGTNIDDILQGVLFTGISYISAVGWSTMIKAMPVRFLCDKSGEGENPQIRNIIVKSYGLHKSYLSELLTRLNEKGKLASSFLTVEETVCDRYNGYYSQKGECLLSLWSVMFFLQSHDVMETYAEMGYIGKCYKKAFADVHTGRLILKLIAKQEIAIKYIKKIKLSQLTSLRDTGVGGDEEKRNILFSLLMEVGFLTNAAFTAPSSSGILNVRVPNTEILEDFQEMFKEYNIQVGQFDQCYVKQCSVLIDDLSRTCMSDDSLFKEYLISFHANLVELFKGFLKYRPNELNERSLQSLMWFACTYTSTFKAIPEYITVDNGRADLWLKFHDEDFYMVFELKVSLTGRLKDWSSMYALKQIKGEENRGNRKIDYAAELKGKEYLLIGLSMDSTLAPSMCVQSSKSSLPIFVSKTEQEFQCFHNGYYKGCYDLFGKKMV